MSTQSPTPSLDLVKETAIERGEIRDALEGKERVVVDG